MRALLQRDHRRATACWRKDFKSEWKKITERLDSGSVSIQSHHTDPVKWTCGCSYFLNSRFLICKHILSLYEPISHNRPEFFQSIERRRECPFWSHNSWSCSIDIDQQALLQIRNRNLCRRLNSRRMTRQILIP
ncbi:hypothetical protein V1522DRAFT_447717 [Lipomyces starkeyi]